MITWDQKQLRTIKEEAQKLRDKWAEEIVELSKHNENGYNTTTLISIYLTAANWLIESAKNSKFGGVDYVGPEVYDAKTTENPN